MNGTGLTRRRILGAGVGFAAGAASGVGGARAETASHRGGARAVRQASALPSPRPLLAADRLGTQLYTVRDKIATIGFARVFEVLAEIGVSHVEFAGLMEGVKPIRPKTIRKLLDMNGLVGLGNASLTTSNPPVSDATFERILDDAETIGLPAVGVSFVNPTANTVAG